MTILLIPLWYIMCIMLWLLFVWYLPDHNLTWLTLLTKISWVSVRVKHHVMSNASHDHRNLKHQSCKESHFKLPDWESAVSGFYLSPFYSGNFYSETDRNFSLSSIKLIDSVIMNMSIYSKFKKVKVFFSFLFSFWRFLTFFAKLFILLFYLKVLVWIFILKILKEFQVHMPFYCYCQ